MVQGEETNDLISFNWEGEGEDFFGIKKETTEVKPVETSEEEEGKPKPKEKEEEEEEEEDDFFDNPTPASTEDDGEGDGQSANNSDDNYWNDIYKDFKETGLLKHVEVEEGEVLTEERLTELQEQDYEAEVSARLQTWATEDLDEDAKAFIKFKREGGNTSDFLETYSKVSEVPSGDITDESYQDEIIRYNLKLEGWDKDEIEDRIEYLTENKRKEKIAKKYDEKIKATQEAEKANLLRQAEENRRIQKENEENFKNSVKDILTSSKEIGGFAIKDNDKTELFNFLTKKTQKISDKKSITPFQKKLAEVFQDTEKTVLLAKLLQSDFDMKDLKRQVITKKTKEIKSNLEQRRNLRPYNSGSSLAGNSLAELFN